MIDHVLHWFPPLSLLTAAGLVVWDATPEGAGVLEHKHLIAIVVLTLVEKALWVETL